MARDKFTRDLEKQLKKIEQNVKKEVDGEVSFSELFNESYMRKYTKFESINEFFEKSPFEVNSMDDLKAIDESEMNAYVSENTSFDSWEKFYETAGKEYVAKKLKKLF